MRRAWLPGLLMAGCHYVHATKLPEIEDARSFLFVIDGDERVVHAWDSELSAELDVSFDGAATVLLLAYRESLAELEIDMGVVPIEEMNGRPLPTPFTVQSAEFGDDGERRWMISTLTSEIEDIRIPQGRNRCFELQTFPIFVSRDDVMVNVRSRTLVPLDEDTAFVSSQNGELFIIDVPARRSTFLDLDLDSPPAAAARGPDGEIWLLDDEGALSRLDLDSRTIDPNFPSTSRVGRVGLVASSPGASFELYAVGENSMLTRFDGSEWSTISPPGLDVDWKASIVWVESQHVYAIGPRHPNVLEVVGESSVEHDITGDDVNVPGRITRLADSRIVVATSHELYLRDGLEWPRIAQSFASVGSNLRSVAAFGDGFLVGAEGGTLLQAFPDVRCEPMAPAVGDINEIYPFRDEFLFASDIRDLSQPPLTVIRKK